ncbi:Hypothetical predicted protein [Mytilus galloprovincialis]|uniref:Reverse transcriptase domain-containing protein n=1 Tax=Mytilus galloprovincialis TaxID=29158 RepID=A0A8B6CZK5_MYTGA|nr:Hypothetical predicted protein [Mytilus galloprovincialis]
MGLLTPVFKNKGSNKNATNYRGITIMPILLKLIESVAKAKVQPKILKEQNRLQRGFTENSAPMNCSFFIEEFIRECSDAGKIIYIALLDAKSAFDVVTHESILRKLYIAGVKQGGILSRRPVQAVHQQSPKDIEHSGLGAKIRSICCAAPTCADDVALMSDNPEELQVLINMAYNYSRRERYKLQPVKSVILPVYPNRRKQQEPSFPWSIGNSIMPIVSQTTHMGVLRTSKPDDPNPLYENVKKARRAMYSLMPAGLHGKNGLDIQSLLHIFNIYVIPVLLYGLELVTPTGKNLDIIDIFHKKCIKQLLSLQQVQLRPPYTFFLDNYQ